MILEYLFRFILGIFIFLGYAYLFTRPEEDKFAGLLIKIFLILTLIGIIYKCCNEI